MDNTDNSLNETVFDNFPNTHTHTHTHESYLLTIIIQLVVPRGTEKPTDLCKAEFGNPTWKH